MGGGGGIPWQSNGWLGLHAFTSKGLGSNPGRRTKLRSHKGVVQTKNKKPSLAKNVFW